MQNSKIKKSEKTKSIKAEHYFSEKQTSRFAIGKIKGVLRGREFEFYTAPGVFSKSDVDKGTQLLVNKMQIPDGVVRALDLGCGYGVVGISVKKFYPDAEVVFTDVNPRAAILTKKNLSLHNLGFELKDVRRGDMFEKINPDEKFDVVLLNPPQTAGKKICFEMISGAKDFLKKGGTLQVVARHNKGGSELSKKMEEVFGNAADIAKKGGYRIYLSEKKQ